MRKIALFLVLFAFLSAVAPSGNDEPARTDTVTLSHRTSLPDIDVRTVLDAVLHVWDGTGGSGDDPARISAPDASVLLEAADRQVYNWLEPKIDALRKFADYVHANYG